MIENIQTLRALAAILIIWVHCQELIGGNVMPAWMRGFGYGGVDLFFVISGFIMVHITARKPLGPGEFFKRRLIRIVPLYYLFTAATLIFVATFPTAFKTTSLDWIAFVKSILFLPFEKSPGRLYPIYYPGWTLNFEMFFYAIFASSLVLPKKVRIFFVTTVLITLVIMGRHIAGPVEYGAYAYFDTRPILLDFVLGMLVAVAVSATNPVMYRPLQWTALAAGAVWLVWGGAWFKTGADGIAPPTDTFFRFGIGAALVVAGATSLERSGTILGGRIGLRLGDASYSIYLAHYFVVGAVIALAHASGIGVVSRVALAPFMMVMAVTSGLVTYLFVERPLAGDFSAFHSLKDAAGRVSGRVVGLKS